MITATAAFTLANLPAERDHSGSEAERYLMLLDWSKTELTALEAGAAGQDAGRRRIREALWTAQHDAQQEIVQAALAAGVGEGAIVAITWRNA